MLVLFRSRLRALLTTVALTLAAPRVAGWLRHVGERQRRRGRPTVAWRAPLGVARALEQVSGRRRRSRLADGMAGAKRAGRRVLHRG
jgi:peptidoglycan/LPS O-acetylase OafA/YrhL